MKQTYGISVPRAAACLLMATLGTGTIMAEDKPAEKSDTPAKEAAKPAEPVNNWDTTISAGATYTSGNSDTLLFNAGVETMRKWTNDNLSLGISGGYGKSSGVKNTELLGAYAQYNHLFNERFYAGLRLEGTYDSIAFLDYRFRVSPLVGYYLVKNKRASLNVEAGPSVIFEKYRHQDEETYLGARFGEKFEYKLTESTRVWQAVEYVPRVDRWAEKYLVTAEVGIETAINKRWNLRVVLNDVYDSDPAADKKKNDIRLIAGTSVKF